MYYDNPRKSNTKELTAGIYAVRGFVKRPCRIVYEDDLPGDGPIKTPPNVIETSEGDWFI